MRTFAIAVAVLFALDLRAARFDVVRNGEAVAGAEVCLFRAGATDNLITRFFASGDVKCVAAESNVEIGAGHWNVFAWKGNTLVSDRVEIVTAEDVRVRRMRLELVEAASLEVPVGEDEIAFVWIPRTRSAMPVVGPVPAALVVPLVIHKSAVTRVGAPVTLAANETRKLDAIASRANHVDAVVRVAFRSVPEDGGEAPVVSVGHHSAAVPLGRADVAIGETLLFFREIPAGVLKTTLSGARWKSAEAKIDEVLEARATTKLTVNWWTSINLAQLAAVPRSCVEKEPDKPGVFHATLAFCGDDKRKLSDILQLHNCTVVGSRELPLNAFRGETTFDNVAAGVYFVVLDYPRLPTLKKQVEIVAREAADIDFEVRFFTFFGKVTRDGQPIAAELYGTVSDATTGRYDAVMARNPRTSANWITICEGAVETAIVPDADPVENAAFDIEIASNRIEGEVVDAESQKAIEKASVEYTAMMDDPVFSDAIYFGKGPFITDEHGRFVIQPVLTNKRLQVCASMDDYEYQCADEFTMGKTKEKHLRFEMKRIVKRRGRIITSIPIEHGSLTWVTRDGRMTELVHQIDADGSFVWTKPHASDEIVSFTAPGHPLFATQHPAVNDRDDLVIRVPNAPRRTFEVSLSETSEGFAFLALRVGNVIVSSYALSAHLQTRRLQSSLHPGRSLLIPDILATGPIRVILIPGEMMLRYPNIALPLVPELGSLPQQDLGDRNAITF